MALWPTWSKKHARVSLCDIKSSIYNLSGVCIRSRGHVVAAYNGGTEGAEALGRARARPYALTSKGVSSPRLNARSAEAELKIIARTSSAV